MTSETPTPHDTANEVERTPRSTIVLIGLRGAGKTTVGRALAGLLGTSLVDTDERIVTQSGLSIAEIFATEGEVGFRWRERDAIERVANERPGVISVGGGAILDTANVERLRAVGSIVWLTAPPKVLWNRVSSDDASIETRPALTELDGLAELERLSRERAAAYSSAADATVETAGESPDAVARNILALLSADSG